MQFCSSQVAQPSELPPSPHVWEWSMWSRNTAKYLYIQVCVSCEGTYITPQFQKYTNWRMEGMMSEVYSYIYKDTRTKITEIKRESNQGSLVENVWTLSYKFRLEKKVAFRWLRKKQTLDRCVLGYICENWHLLNIPATLVATLHAVENHCNECVDYFAFCLRI